LGDNRYDIRHIAGAEASAYGQLNAFEQTAFSPLLFQPFCRDCGPSAFDLTTTTALTDKDLSDYFPLRSQHGQSIRAVIGIS
jgi:hypothetical protein